MKDKKFYSSFEIMLLVCAIFAFAYILGGGFEDNLVSAVEDPGLSISTCLKDNEGNVCQEYLSSECDENCQGTCVPSSSENIDACQLGTCYDDVEGYCLENSPKKLCQDLGSTWIDDPNGNIPECRNGCCVTEDGTFFETKQECNRRGNFTGEGSVFDSEITAEWECLLLGGKKEEGACVFLSDSEGVLNDCKFVQRHECENMQGDFYPNTLCSNPELETKCEKQVDTGCFEGLDEVYWVDSCGNRENIYDVNKLKSWNDGRALLKNESCSLFSGNDFLGNQESCGNCDYLAGSSCGVPGELDKDADIGDLVCKSLDCIDSEGNRRRNGESWCVYQGSVGLEGEKASGTPGSSHYKESCVDGEIQNTLCGPARTGICIESQTELPNGDDYSSASCKMNQALVCLNYNEGGKLEHSGDAESCRENPDCYVKGIHISEDINFKTCLPKYPIGNDLVDNPEGANALCNMASLQCVSVWVKTAESGGIIGEERSAEWQCVANCNCESDRYIERMHDFCMSLGDCGGSVNYLGEYTKNYRVTTAINPKTDQKINFLGDFTDPTRIDAKDAIFTAILNGMVGVGVGTDYSEEDVGQYVFDLGDNYVDKIKTFHEVDEGEYIEANETIDYVTGLNSPAKRSGLAPDASELLEGIQHIQNLKGASGIAQSIASMTSLGTIVEISSFVGDIFAGGEGAVTNTGGFTGAVAGAIIGFALSSLAIDKLGIAPGLDKDQVNGLLAAGTLSGGLIGYGITGTAFTAPSFVVGIVLLIIAIVTYALLSYGNVGDIQYDIVSFKCQPWTPPKGGDDCERCGEDGLRCNKYACQSLGANCRFINEGSDEEQCVDISPDDNDVPVISARDDSLLESYSYVDSPTRDVRIASNNEDGCIDSGRLINFGIEVDEPAECRWDFASRSFEEMELEFDSGNLLMSNHSTTMLVPSLERLGQSSYDPEARAELDLLIRCEDSSGNSNVRDYVIDMCIKRGVDLTPPLIVEKEPEVNFVKFGASEQDVSIWTNEPAECRWDDVDKDYSQMDNQMECLNEIEFVEPSGWRCNSTFPVINNVNTYSIRCKDQPTLANVNESARNANTQGYNLTIRKSASRLNFDVIKPVQGEIVESPTDLVSLKMVLETNGGMNNDAICSYIVNEQEIEFFNTGGTTHNQLFELYGDGRHVFDVICRDRAGNEAKGNVVGDIEVDTRPPKITKVYNRGGVLNIITDEEASCYYRNIPTRGINECSYELNEAEEMADEGRVHTTPLDISKTYYVRCVDEFENSAPGCSIILLGQEIPNV